MVGGKQEAWLGCTLGSVAFCSLAPFLFYTGLKKELARSTGLLILLSFEEDS